MTTLVTPRRPLPSQTKKSSPESSAIRSVAVVSAANGNEYAQTYTKNGSR